MAWTMFLRCSRFFAIYYNSNSVGLRYPIVECRRAGCRVCRCSRRRWRWPVRALEVFDLLDFALDRSEEALGNRFHAPMFCQAPTAEPFGAAGKLRISKTSGAFPDVTPPGRCPSL